ncbi:MAG TPA: response regulator [Gemmatimonadaceae bacterium]|nr:response regulator [Gemmatimonadaceae bacterium]
MAEERVNILLVDDQPGKLLSYEAMLSDLGETLIRAQSASEALEQLLRNEIAVVLIDVCMPELDGFELASMIRAHPRYQKTAIILVSAVLINDVYRLKGYHAGAVDYVGVPVVPEILRAKVAIFADLYRKNRRLEQMNEELEKRVAERTTELRESDKRKDEFLAMLAHELRNPLAPVRNSLHLVRGSSDERIRENALDVMDRQLGHLVRLVDDLLDVSRITTGKLELRTGRVDLGQILRHAVETAQAEISRKEHKLTVDVPESGLVMEGDATRLTQVFANLLHNASKFTDRGGTLAIKATRTGSDVEVTVTDNGEGIQTELLAGIFEMFSQADRSLERRHGGLGIGLTMAKRLVEMHGGSIVAKSDGLGKGSEFSVRLPLATGVAVPEQRPVSGKWPAVVTRRILVADDNPDSLESLALVLRLKGNDVRTASDGMRAIAEADAFQPDVILLDIGMPNMNGYDACRLIRGRDWGREVLLIALTGWGQDEDREKSRAAGFDHHLVKPVDPETLLRHVAKHFGKIEELRPANTI